MRLAMMDTFCPGRKFKNKVELMDRMGFDGIEVAKFFHGDGLLRNKEEFQSILSTSKLKLATIAVGYRGDLLAAERSAREKAIEDIILRLNVCADLDGVGVLTIPSFFMKPEIPDLYPWLDTKTIEQRVLVEEYKILAKSAEDAGVYVIIEPMDRFRTHIINTCRDAAKLCQESDSDKVRICADTFHMTIEEPEPIATIGEYANLMAHFHLGDDDEKSQFARLPGKGKIGFQGIFQALKTHGYTGYLSFDCKVNNKSALRESVEFVKQML